MTGFTIFRTSSFAAPIILALLLTGSICVPGTSMGGEVDEGMTDSSTSPTGPHIVFLINEDPHNYEAHETVPLFAERLEEEYDYRVTVVEAEGDLPALRFPNLDVLSKADLLVIFFRRAALPVEQLERIKNYLDGGRPLVGIRTANHAFSVRDAERSEIPEAYEDWWGFVPDILGCTNKGYGPPEEGTEVSVAEGAAGHPILDGFQPTEWHSDGVLYHVAPLLDEEATVLLTGSIEEAEEPIAWTRMAGDSRVFYTSLGYPDDFEQPAFRSLLINGIAWALEGS